MKQKYDVNYGSDSIINFVVFFMIPILLTLFIFILYAIYIDYQSTNFENQCENQCASKGFEYQITYNFSSPNDKCFCKIDRKIREVDINKLNETKQW